MPSRRELLTLLDRFATLLELDGANTFKVNAYTKAIRVLGDEAIDLAAHVGANTLTTIDGIGKGIADKATEYWNTGAIAELDELAARFPPGLLEMTTIPGFGAKKARAVHDALGIATIAELEAACGDGRVADLKGFGKKSAEKILQGIELRRRHSGRHRIDIAREAALPLLAAVRGHASVTRAEVAGSLRRWRETAKDIDIVCATGEPEAVIAMFVALPGIESITGQGATKASVVLASGLNADLRCVSEAEYPFALQYFSGSKEHNTRLRGIAKDKGLKLNEYGLYPEGSEESLAAADEAAIYRHLGLEYVEPELREDMGEIDAAREGRLPRLVAREDLRGLLHLHTHYSDGQPQVEDYARWASENGFSWMGLADHSQAAAYANGLKPDRVRAQWAEIDEVNARWAAKGVRLLKGIESDILADGSLDYDEDLLAGFDFIVASVHSQFQLSEADQTARILRAIENPFTTILGHMTGRLILKRDGYAVDQKALIRACAVNGVAVEINANPHRLDIDWRLIHFALDEGCMLSIGPDAHVMGGLEDYVYGLAMARKGWAGPDRIVNCMDADGFLAWARSRRKS